jgi:hypothetical protein
MSLKDKASLIFKPSRYKAGTAYSFRGPDWTFTRASAGTRVNASGLIETVAASIPRICYDPADLTKDPYLLLEGSKTNLIAHSQLLDSWTKENISVVYNAGIAPDGTNTANKLIPDSVSTDHSVYKPGASWTTHTFSIFAKAAEYSYIYVGKNNDFATDGAFFDLRTGVISQNTSSLTASIEDYGNGWYRCSVYGDISYALICPSQNGTSFSFAGDGVKGVLAWGGQVEANKLTSYIPTVSSSDTRVTDFLIIENMQTTTNKSVQGTFYVDVAGSDDGTIGDAIIIRNSNTPLGRAYYYQRQFGFADTWGSSTEPNSIDGVRFKHIWRLDNSSTGTFFQGGKKYNTVDTSTQAWNNVYQFYFSPAYATMKVYEIYIAPSALSDEDCIALTSFDDYEELVDVKGLTWESPTITNNRLTALAEL